MLIIGDSECTFGLAKRIRDNMLFALPSTSPDNAELKYMAHAIASAIVAECVANGLVVVTGVATPAGVVTGTGVIT